MIKIVMGFDYGQKRIGVAVGQTLTASANPLAIITVQQNKPDWARITELIQTWQPETLVVGLPLHADGTDTEITQAARRFSRQMAGRYQLPVHLIDETLTSLAADALIRNRATNRKQTQANDAVAAQIILETWFSECLR